MRPDLSQFATSTFIEQRAQIDALLAQQQIDEELLSICASLPDAEPLSYVLRALAASGQLRENARLGAPLAQCLSQLPDANLAKALRALEQLPQVRRDPRIIDEVTSSAAESLQGLPIERVAAICFLDRWLKNVSPSLRAEICALASSAVQRSINANSPEEIRPKDLLLSSSTQLQALAALADSRQRAWWPTLLEKFAHRILSILAAAPKSLSQANAEEILSKRVYTDPGHFFVELLQNAEDARARSWRVAIQRDIVSLWHDGTPFDAKDVVGVLSIGQTTKMKGQIGFFGVGFKSVYEVTDRPQLYSGPYLFEIADVSLPKRLSRRPSSAPKDGTLLQLPLRPEHSHHDLYKKLSRVPPQTLLMLDSLQEIAISCDGEARTIQKTTEQSSANGAELTLSSLLQTETGRRESFFIERGRFAFSGERETSRASETPVLIAILLGDAQLPVALPASAETIFSYLPTKEQSGLRFLLHAHFDLPVDRERLHLASPWNQWALSLAADLLWSLLQKITIQQNWAATRAMLSVLPLPEDATHPAFQQISLALQEKIQGSPLAILPGAADEHLDPKSACIIEDQSLLPLLRGMTLGQFGAPLSALSPREEKLARFFGVNRFGSRGLVSFLGGALAQSGAAAPSWLQSPGAIETLLHSLGSIQDSTLQAQLREMAILPASPGLIHRFAVPPLHLQNGEGQRLFIASDIVRGTAELRQLYHGVREFLSLALDQSPSFSQERLFVSLGVKTLSADDVLQDLQRGTLRQQLVSTRLHLWEFLAALPLAKTSALASLPLFEAEGSRLLPLVGDGCVYLPPDAHLSRWFASLSGERPPVLHSSLQEARPFFARLGATTLDLSTMLSLIQNGALQINTEEATRLHWLIEEMQRDLSPKLCEQLAKSKIFPAEGGQLRALLGGDVAHLAEDEEVRSLAPGGAWLSSALSSLSYLRLLPATRIGAVHVAETLLFEHDLFDPLDINLVRASYLYLQPRAHLLSQALRDKLKAAPVWLSSADEQLMLSRLRQAPRSLVLQALYQRWRSSPLIDEDASRLALSIGLRTDLIQLDHNTFISDLLREAPSMTGELRPLVLAALEESARVLSRADLVAVRQAKIFGASQPLGTWEAPFAGGCLRVTDELRPLLQNSALPLLSTQDEHDLSLVLSIIGERASTIIDVVTVGSQELSSWSIEARAMLRALLIHHQSQLSGVKTKLAALSLWPTSAGVFLPAGAVVRASELRRLLGDDSWAQGESTLAKDAEADAEALQSIVTFKAPLDIVVQKIRAEARPGEPLSAQPSFLSTINALTKLLALLSKKLEPAALLALPLWVDLARRLQPGPRLSASAEEIFLVGGSSLEAELVEREWSASLVQQNLSREFSQQLAPRLTARRLLSVIAESSRETIEAREHPIFASAEKRAALYQWILQRAEEIETDSQAHGVLGRACVLLAPSGLLRAPRDFLFMPEPEGLSLDWSPHEEVPTALIQWLRRVYRIEEQRLGQVVQKLLEAHEEAMLARELERSAPLLRTLSRVLTSSNAGDLPQLVERFRVVKTLRVESETGEITKPKKLFATSQEKWSLLQSFMKELPERPAARYQEEPIIALLRAAGAKADLNREELRDQMLFFSGADGLDKMLGFARYLGLLLSENPSLIEELSLDKTPWLPDGEGKANSPRALYWPTPEVRAVLGEDPSLFAHPEFSLTMPLSVQQKLSFRTLQTANPEDVAERLSQLPLAPIELLRWLQQALQDRRVEVAWVRPLFQDKALFLDESGSPRRAKELLRESAHELFGSRRAVWPEAQKLARLADAVGIPASVGRREVLAFLQEIAGENLHGLLDREPSLRGSLLNCLSFLAASPTAARSLYILDGEGRGEVPLLVEDGERQRVCLSNDPAVRLPEPEELYEKAKREQRPFLFVILPEESRDEVVAWLQTLGVATLGAPPKATEKAHPEEKKGLFSRLRQMFTKEEDDPTPPSRGEDSAPLPLKPKGQSPTKSPTAPEGQPSPQEDWMRPRAAINEQLRGSPDWVESRARPPSYGFSFAPKDLPPPYRYAPMLIADRFEPRSQRWSRDAVLALWEAPASQSEDKVVFKGKLPAGESILPVPLYGRLLKVEAAGEVRQLVTRDGQPLLRSAKDVSLTYEVALDVAPEFLEEAPAPQAPALQKKTVPDEDLPQEVHSFLLQLKGAPGLQKALEIRDFIRERYRYDPSYLEDPEIARWLRQVSYHNANMHISALHAGRDARHLGRGVCYELNALACELMRRAGVPAAVVTGWTLERGSATEPDHMWSVALIESNVGPRWLPIDASTTRDGRPLRVAHRPAGPWRAKAPNTSLPKAPRWMEGRGTTQRTNLPTAEFFAVVRHLATLSGQSNLDEEALAKKCREILQDKDAAKQLLALLQEDK